MVVWCLGSISCRLVSFGKGTTVSSVTMKNRNENIKSPSQWIRTVIGIVDYLTKEDVNIVVTRENAESHGNCNGCS